MAERRTYSLAELLAQCDPDAPAPKEFRYGEQSPSVGLEQAVMES